MQNERRTDTSTVLEFLAIVSVLSIPLENALLVGGAGSVAKLSGLAMIALFGFRMAQSGRFRSRRPFGMLLICQVCWSMTSLGWTSDYNSGLTRVTLLVQVSLFGLVLSQVANDDLIRARLRRAFGLGATAAALLVVQNWNRGVGAYGLIEEYDPTIYTKNTVGQVARYSVGGEDPNHMGAILVMGALLLAFDAYANRRFRIVAFPAIGLCLFASLLTGSRGSSVLAPAAVVAYLFFNRSGSLFRRAVWAALVTPVLFGIGWQLLPGPTRLRLSTSFDSKQSTSNLREEIWIAGINAWKSRPIWGTGTGSYQTEVRAALSRPLVAHNSSVSQLVELGLIGFFLWASVLGVLWFRSGNLSLLDRLRSRSMLLLWFVSTTFAGLEYKKLTFFVLAILAAQVSDPGPAKFAAGILPQRKFRLHVPNTQ